MFGVNDIIDLLFSPGFLAMSAAAIIVFATIVTLGLPLMERDTLNKRLKAVAERREELRARHKEALSGRRGSGLRTEAVGSTKLIKQIVERFNLSKLVASEGTQEKLQQAGMRGPTPTIVFNFFRFVMPFAVFAAALFYLFVVTHLAGR